VTASTNARGAVHLETDIVPASQLCLSGVQSHAHPHLSFLWPGMVKESSLRFDCGGERIRSVGEDDEEGVALGADLASPPGLKGGTEQLLMGLDDGFPALAQVLEQARGALDVGEEKADSARREIRHHCVLLEQTPEIHSGR